MKVLIGKIFLEGDKSYFVSEDGKIQEAVALNNYELQEIKKYPDSKVIFKNRNDKYFLQIVNSNAQIEELVYHLNFDAQNQKAYLTTYSNPSYDPESFKEHIAQNPYNKVAAALYYCPDGKVFKLENATFWGSRMDNKNPLTVEEYEERISKFIGNKIIRLQKAGINTDDFQVVYSNIREARYNKQTFNQLQEELYNSYLRQTEYGDFAYGYVSYTIDKKNGSLWAEKNPVTTTGARGKSPFYLHGNFPNPEEYQQYGFEQIERALGTYKEKKQEAPQEEEACGMSPF